jgi:hypothetical protein
VNRTVEQVSKISQMASPDIRGQWEFPGVPDRSTRRMNLVFRAGVETHGHEFDLTTLPQVPWWRWPGNRGFRQLKSQRQRRK